MRNFLFLTVSIFLLAGELMRVTRKCLDSGSLEYSRRSEKNVFSNWIFNFFFRSKGMCPAFAEEEVDTLTITEKTVDINLGDEKQGSTTGK